MYALDTTNRVPNLNRSSYQFQEDVLIAAVNTQHRDVIIKMIRNDSPELHIIKVLASDPMRSDPLNLSVPVLEILEYDEEYSFVVMPRWGDTDPIIKTGFDCLETAFKFVEDVLKALTFLHNNLIAHRDLKLGNILLNYQYGPEIHDLRPFLSTKRARFVLCDFGLSVMFSPDIPLSQRICPAEESERGSAQYHPIDDVGYDQIAYDPFSYDVASLGGVLCELVGYMTPLVPPLAPFLDRLVTPDITTRYSAAQALEAFLELKNNMDPAFLSSTVPPSPSPQNNLYVFSRWQDHDRWAGLPPDFVQKHAAMYELVRPKKWKLP
ncbi:hypothetical protein QCA50_020711 [Cerrena zonata]|uniref:Protein kinase domain-containing protein n=1 Tax=Cerrena zonata TaxID=2478898 RepID=A0AAW0F7R6_9APHY